MYAAYVTISGFFPEMDNYDYLNIELSSPDFETMDGALRWYDTVYVTPFGTLARYLHELHPEATELQAEYDVFDTDHPAVDLGWYWNEVIWWED